MSKRVEPTMSSAPLDAPWVPTRIGLGLTMREAGFALLAGLSIAWAWQPLATVIGRSLKYSQQEHYSHIVLLPFITAYFLYLNRHAIAERIAPARPTGTTILLAGAAAVWLAGSGILVVDPEHRLSVAMLGLVTMWTGAFVICYGIRSLRAVLFPFAFLLLMVPLPPALLDGIIGFLQQASADASEILFGLIGVPQFRQGFFFVLPGLTIEVAKECSGIRSSLALMISSLVMSYLFLRSTWSRLTLVLVVVPLTVVKNALRIVVLSWLAIHVDPRFITGSTLHERGGIPLFLTSLAILGGIVWILRKGETRIGATSAVIRP